MTIPPDLAEIKPCTDSPLDTRGPLRLIRTAENYVIVFAGPDVCGVIPEDKQAILAQWLMRRVSEMT